MTARNADVCTIRRLLQHAKHHDKDERFMATSDLISELENIDKLDEALLEMIRDTIIAQLDDSSDDVQAVAVKCLSTIVRKFGLSQVAAIVHKLGNLILEGNTDLCDVYGSGIRTAINSVSIHCAANLCAHVAPTLLKGIRSNGVVTNSHQTQIVCLDLLKELIKRFGSSLVEHHQDILDEVFTLLVHRDDHFRDHATTTIGILVPYLEQSRFESMMSSLVKRVQSMDKQDIFLYTYVQTIGVISRTAGVRIGAYLDVIVPLLLSFTKLDAHHQQNEEQRLRIELAQNCLQAFEALVLHCTKQINEHIDAIISLSIELAAFDPNVDHHHHANSTSSGDREQNTANTVEDVKLQQVISMNDDEKNLIDDDDDWNDFDEDGHDDEDDDNAWKVRKASLNVLSAVITSRIASHSLYAKTIAETLISRFNERENHVKLVVFQVFLELLRLEKIEECKTSTTEKDSDIEISFLASKFDEVLVLLLAHCSDGNNRRVNDRVAALEILLELFQNRQDQIDVKHISLLFSVLLKCVRETETNMKIAALMCLSTILEYSSSSSHQNSKANIELAKHFESIVALVECAIHDDYTRVRTLLLHIAQCLYLRMDEQSIKKTEYDMFALRLGNCILPQLELQDVDITVKKASIKAISIAINLFAPAIVSLIEKSLILLIQRLSHAACRPIALQAFIAIASTNNTLCNLSNVMPLLLHELKIDLGRISTSNTRYDTILTLSAIFKMRVHEVQPDHMGEVVTLLIDCIRDDDNDMRLSHLVLESLDILFQHATSLTCLRSCTELLRSKIIDLSTSSAIHGSALNSLLHLLRTLARRDLDKLSRQNFISSFSDIFLSLPNNDCGLITLSKCLATVIVEASVAQTHSSTSMLITHIQHSSQRITRLCLLCMGEVGRCVDLDGVDGLTNTIIDALDNQSDDVRWAASFALGNVAVGNLSSFMPIVIRLINEGVTTRRYALLHALKLIIIHQHLSLSTKAFDQVQSVAQDERFQSDVFSEYLPKITTILFDAVTMNEGIGVRVMISECIGRLASINESVVASRVLEQITSSSADVRSTMVAALKFASLHEHSILRIELPRFLALLNDENLDTRREALLTVNSLLHASRIAVLHDFLHNLVLPRLYSLSQPYSAYVHEVDYGPFKQTIDEGLPLRKAALECLRAVVEANIELSHNIAEDNNKSSHDEHPFMSIVRSGLSDSFEVQSLVFNIITSLATKTKTSTHFINDTNSRLLVQFMPTLSALFMHCLKEVLRHAKEPEPERANDVLRAAVRAVAALEQMQLQTQQCEEFVKFLSRVHKTPRLQTLLAKMQQKSHCDEEYIQIS